MTLHAKPRSGEGRMYLSCLLWVANHHRGTRSVTRSRETPTYFCLPPLSYGERSEGETAPLTERQDRVCSPCHAGNQQPVHAFTRAGRLTRDDKPTPPRAEWPETVCRMEKERRCKATEMGTKSSSRRGGVDNRDCCILDSIRAIRYGLRFHQESVSRRPIGSICRPERGRGGHR